MSSAPVIEPAKPSAFEARMVTLTVMLGAVMAIVDTSIVNVALPAIGEDFRATVDQLSMVATGFIIAGVLVMPMIGYLTARLGRKQFFMLSLGFFILASIACGLAWSVESLAFFRVLQGLGGGTLVPVSQAIMLESHPKEQHGKAMSTFGMGVTVGPAIGPVLGGWLTATYSWHWIFLVNVPVGLLTLFLAWKFMHNPDLHEKPKGRFDWAGLLAMIVGLASLQMLLELGHRLGWFTSGWIIGMAALSVAGLVYFIRRQLTTPHPVVDLSVMRDSSFALSCIIGLVLGLGLYGVLVVLPLFMEAILGFDSLSVGLALTPGAVATGAMMPLSGFLTDRFDPRLTIAGGLVISALSLFAFSLVPDGAGVLTMGSLMALRGVGMGLLFVPMTALAMSGMETRKIAGAAGLFTLIRQLGGSFGIAILTGLLAVLHNGATTLVSENHDPDAYALVFRVSACAFLVCLLPLVLMKGRPSKELSPEALPEI